MTLEEIKGTIQDLVSVEPKSFASDRQASEAAAWVALQKQAESDINLILDPEIKRAYEVHKARIAAKKGLLERLDAAKNRVRYHLANWIVAGHNVESCYTKTTYKVTVKEPEKVPDEYAYRAIDEDKLQEWVKITEGKQAVPGCTIEPVHVLYFKEKP